jgi:hypothetical protein
VRAATSSEPGEPRTERLGVPALGSIETRDRTRQGTRQVRVDGFSLVAGSVKGFAAAASWREPFQSFEIMAVRVTRIGQGEFVVLKVDDRLAGDELTELLVAHEGVMARLTLDLAACSVRIGRA